MREEVDRRVEDVPPAGRLPAWLPRVLAAVIAWFALAAWSFAGPGPTNYLLVIVSGFIFFVVGLQFVLSRIGGRNGPAGEVDHSREFREVNVFQSRLRISEAAAQILLPMLAAAVGMTAIGIVFLLVEHGSA